MRRMLSRKSHSWWWDSHISRKNSKWLAQNLARMDKSVKEMLKLIEEEGESFAQKAEMYYRKRPQLISYVEDFYRMYRALAERYDQVTDDLRKNVESELNECSGSGSDLELTPEGKLQELKSNPRAAGFDFFLGSGGSSDLSKKGSDGSFSLSSVSDSEVEFDETSEVNGDDVTSKLRQRVQELEDKLLEMKEKLKMEEEKNYHDEGGFKTLLLEEELLAANEKLDTAEADIVDLKWKLEVTSASLDAKIVEFNLEKKKVCDLEEHTVMLQNEITGLKNEAETLRGVAEAAAKQLEIELSSCAFTIDECKNELDNSREAFVQEKSRLEAIIMDLEGANMGEVEKMMQENLALNVRSCMLGDVILELNASTARSNDKILREKSALEAKLKDLTQSNAALEDKVTILGSQMRQLEIEKTRRCNEKNKHIDELNSSLDALTVKADTLTAEKEELASKMDSLINEIKRRDDQIFQMDKHLQNLHLEHTNLIVGIEETARNNSDLKSRLKDLEEEVDRQKVAISDAADGKREAIRQLCFSLEHYRVEYHRLWHLLQGHKRWAVMAR